MIFRTKKKGVALLWALVTSTVLFLIAAITANAIIKESHMTVNIEDSTKAYAAAVSGVEWAKWCIDNQDRCSDTSRAGTIDGSDFSVNYLANTPSPGIYRISSNGTRGQVNRKLEYSYTASPFLPITLDSYKPAAKPSIEGCNELAVGEATCASGSIPSVNFPDSFTFQFDMWKLAGGYYNSGAVFVGLGVKGDNSGSKIRFHYNYVNPASEYFYLTVHESGNAVPIRTTPRQYLNLLPAPGIDMDDPSGYAIRVKMRYVKDSSVEVTVTRKDWVTDQKCTMRFSTNLSGVTFAGPFDYIDGDPGTNNGAPTTGVGDGYVMKMAHDEGGVNTFGFLDNFGYKK